MQPRFALVGLLLIGTQWVAAVEAPVSVSFNGAAAPAPSLASCDFALIAGEQGPQVAVLGRSGLAVSVRSGEVVRLTLACPVAPAEVDASVDLLSAEVAFGVADAAEDFARLDAGRKHLTSTATAGRGLRLSVRGVAGEAVVRFSRLALNGQPLPLVWPPAAAWGQGAPPSVPALRPGLGNVLVEWDWRMQDGLGTAREPSSYPAAVALLLARGDQLVRDLANPVWLREWAALQREVQAMPAEADPLRWEALWLRAHRLRRSIALSNPLAQTGPLAFIKQVPSCFSHQLTQYYGASARPGGGVFVLDAPGRSLTARQLAPAALPAGSYQHPEVSFDGQRLLFAYCRAETAPPNRETYLDRSYHLYEMKADGSGLRQLTDGPFDDFAPRYLPDGKLLFLSTRRGGYHRCGRGPCPTYALATAEADGANPRPISFHETHEWDPCLLPDGRVIYTRWDYVDRDAVHYQQLWTTHPDGTEPQAYYGNATFNPVGLWEARPVPGTSLVMATAAAHHAMTAGSIVLLDTRRGYDGAAPLTRLTPDARFPESEEPVSNGAQGMWSSPLDVDATAPVPVEARRWPGHCYRSAFPLSASYFLASYSYDPLLGEPAANPPNQFGLYLVDRFGNKELLYRDPNLSSLWPTPLRARTKPPVLPSTLDPTLGREGSFYLANVYSSWPTVPAGSVRRLRVLQVLPKSTPHANDPTVGAAFASPGKQVLGTVPVEADGSAWFRAPAEVPLCFQALDERGEAVQEMRSITYLQAGQKASCVGCHAPRGNSPARHSGAALRRAPSTLTPGPDGSAPFSYPLLVQPVLDQRCVSCHQPGGTAAAVPLTGAPTGRYSASYAALLPYVRYSAWGSAGDFRVSNSEPVTQPGFFGAAASRLTTLLRAGHHGVTLTTDDWDRLTTWMDANALFYGTFDPADQARQLRGERIAGPAIQ